MATHAGVTTHDPETVGGGPIEECRTEVSVQAEHLQERADACGRERRGEDGESEKAEDVGSACKARELRGAGAQKQCAEQSLRDIERRDDGRELPRV